MTRLDNVRLRLQEWRPRVLKELPHVSGDVQPHPQQASGRRISTGRPQQEPDEVCAGPLEARGGSLISARQWMISCSGLRVSR